MIKDRIMYIGLAGAIVFVMVCIGIKYKSSDPSNNSDISSIQTNDAGTEALTEQQAVLEMIKNQTETQPEKKEPLPGIIKGPVLALSGLRNIVKNPSANNGSKNWTLVKSVSIEPMKRNNPAFVLRDDGRLKQKVKLTNAGMQFVVVGASGNVNSINRDRSDPAGLPLLRIYFEDRFNKSNTDESTEIIMTRINQNGWGQIGVVKQIPENTLFLHLELYQAKGKSSIKGKITRFDDIFVSIARNKEAGNKMLQSYISQAEAFIR